METIKPQEIRKVINDMNKSIKRLNEIKEELKRAHLFSYQDFHAETEIEMIIDFAKTSVMNL